jgi:hypothetical protein
MSYSDFYVKGSGTLQPIGVFWRNCYIFRTINGFVAIDKKLYVKNSTRIIYIGYTPSTFFEAVQMDNSVIAGSFEVESE